ncbi:MAG: PilZ domain-containing protein [Bacteriovoracaceae bacterium]|nr:PilZ domain-containing protein [Bacteriovoracaceae bacterium]
MSDKKVFDFEQKRKQSIEQKRRTFERVLFDEFLGVDAVIDDNGSGFPVKLIDISADGCQFQVPFTAKARSKFSAESEVTLKLFFTKTSFLPVVVKIRHTSEYIDQKGDAHWRCGGEFDQSLPSFQALASFVQFIYKYAEFSCHDSAAHKVYFL